MSRPPLLGESRFWSRAEDRQRAVNALFDRGAAHYDRVCNVMSFGSGQRYRRYWETIEHCVPPDVVIRSLADAGFAEVRRDVEAGIFSAYTGRRGH